MNKFEKGDMEWLKRILTGTELITTDGYADNILSHGRTERIVNHIEHLEGDREFFQNRDLEQCRVISRNHREIDILKHAELSADDTIRELKDRIEQLQDDAASTWRATQKAFDEYDGEIDELKNRIKLLEKYVDHQMQCTRRTIHRACFSDKNPCNCGFDDLGIELVHTPIRTKSKKYMLPSRIKRKNLTA